MLVRILTIAWLTVATLRALSEPPVIPVGMDAYRRWDLWPNQRIGARAYMRSTYDRRGANESADASHFLYQRTDDFNVTLDLEGQGCLYFARYNHWHGSPWHYVVDGTDYLVQESSTANPNHPVPGSVFLPQRPFPNPFTWTWSQTKGADLMWVPIGFERSFQMAYSRTRYGTGYYIWHQYVRGAALSQPIQSWTTNDIPPVDVVALLNQAGDDLLPARGSAEAAAIGLSDLEGHAMLPPGRQLELVSLTNAPAVIRGLEFTVSESEAPALGRCRLRVTWDGRREPSIDAPVALFYGAGTLYNRDQREYLVKAFPVSVRFKDGRVHLSCFFPMPFFASARIALISPSAEDVADISWRVRTAPLRQAPNSVGYFHASYRDHRTPVPGQDMVLLDTRESEGGGDWTGSFVGTSLIFSDRAVLNTLEGDPRFFFDDSQTPQAYGTGTEEWSGGGDYWGGRNMTLPFAGHPTGARNVAEAKNAEDQIQSAYRYLLADLMPFGKNAVIRLEHGGMNESTEHYQTLAYWYGLPAASLVKTDTLRLGDSASERAHQYSSPGSTVYELHSRYEWGVDTLAGQEIYPAHTERGRKTSGESEFVLRLRPENLGVLLRRKLDYAFPNQRAEVFVADAGNAGQDPRKLAWQRAGVWLLAGSNTCVYSDPKEELGATQHNVQTSNRRFRDDEFLVPRDLTQGRDVIRVRIVFTPVRTPLFPGHPLPELAWSEIRYDAYCFVEPAFSATGR